MNGAARIRGAFAAARAAGRAALIPYVVCGRPSAAGMPDLVHSLVEAGADLVELGVPFSDPLADGSVIRDATRRALDDGVTVSGCLEVVRAIRAAGSDVPIVLMGYVNPLLSYGMDRFCADAAAAGVDGLIIPDVRLEQSDELRDAADRSGLGLVFLATPLTAPERMPRLAEASTGFLYAVATTGTTGAREAVEDATIELLDRARSLADDVPVAVGFGVSRPEHVERLRDHADGVIVGSALVERIERDAASVGEALGALHRATRRDPVAEPAKLGGR